MNTNPHSKAITFLNAKGKLSDFHLIDVGCSGGIADYWIKAFGDHLKAVGFDPLINEVQKLNKDNLHNGITYKDAFIRWKEYDTYFPKSIRDNPIKSQNNCSFDRTSGVEAAKILDYDYIKTHFNSNEEISYSSKHIDLDDYFKDHKFKADFIKIDTDGHDFECLLGAQKSFESDCLGLLVECQFHGPLHPYANTFCNIDRFLREQGFTLFSITPYNHSKGVLPDVFTYDLFAQTKKGQVRWGDALYLRDFGDKDYEKKFPKFSVTKDRLIKMACLYSLFQQEDSLVEMVHNRGQDMGLSQSEKTELLNSVTPLFRGKQLSYEEYITKFKKDPTQWFPSKQPVATKKTLKRLYSDYLSHTAVGKTYRSLKKLKG